MSFVICFQKGMLMKYFYGVCLVVVLIYLTCVSVEHDYNYVFADATKEELTVSFTNYSTNGGSYSCNFSYYNADDRITSSNDTGFITGGSGYNSKVYSIPSNTAKIVVTVKDNASNSYTHEFTDGNYITSKINITVKTGITTKLTENMITWNAPIYTVTVTNNSPYNSEDPRKFKCVLEYYDAVGTLKGRQDTDWLYTKQEKKNNVTKDVVASVDFTIPENIAEMKATVSDPGGRSCVGICRSAITSDIKITINNPKSANITGDDSKEELTQSMISWSGATFSIDFYSSGTNEALLYTSQYVNLDFLLDLVESFCILSASLWAVWGLVMLAGSLKDKNGPGLQSSMWQIVGSMLIIAATYLFRNIADDGSLLNKILDLISKFSMMGGALWTIWGVIILASALKDKTGPTLQAAIWQIVGGIMVMSAAVLFTTISYNGDSNYVVDPTSTPTQQPLVAHIISYANFAIDFEIEYYGRIVMINSDSGSIDAQGTSKIPGYKTFIMPEPTTKIIVTIRQGKISYTHTYESVASNITIQVRSENKTTLTEDMIAW